MRLEVALRQIHTGAWREDQYDPSLPLAFRLARLFGLSIEEIFQEQAEPKA